MITIYKNIQVTSSTNFPMNFAWSSSSPCISFSEQQGVTATGLIQAEIYFDNETCLTQQDVTLTITDSEGCTQSFAVTYTNPCQSLVLSPITKSDPFNYSVTATGGYGPVTYTWVYDGSLFTSTGQISAGSTGSISLQLTGSDIPPSTTISVTATDGNGCQETTTYVEQLCPPIANSVGVLAQYSPFRDYTFQAPRLTPPAVACAFALDLSTLSFVAPSGVSVEYSSGYIYIYGTEAVANTTKNIAFTVKDIYGIESNQGTITVVFPSTEGFVGPVVPSTIITANSSTIVGTEFTVPVGDMIYPPENVDWDTATVVTAATAGSVSYSAGKRQFKYTVSSLATPVDKFDWSIDDLDGNRSNTATVYVNYYVQGAPTAVADTMCATCGGTSDFKDLTANDTGAIDPRTVTITQNPPGEEGYVSVSPDGTVAYSALADFEGSSIFKYKVANSDLDYSNEATVTVTVVCAGHTPTSPFDITCYSSQAFSLADMAGGVVSAGTTWTETSTIAPDYGTQGGTILGGSAGNVDFTAILPGTYSFEGSVTTSTCTHTCTITVVKIDVDYIANNTCSGAYELSYPTTAGSTSVLTNQDNGEDCPSYLASAVSTVNSNPVSNEQAPPSWTAPFAGDVWFKFTVGASSPTAVDIEIDGSSYGTLGIYNPQIVAYSSSGLPCTLNDFVYVFDNGVATGTQFVRLPLSGLTPSTTYWLRVGNSGTGNSGKFNIKLIT